MDVTITRSEPLETSLRSEILNDVDVTISSNRSLEMSLSQQAPPAGITVSPSGPEGAVGPAGPPGSSVEIIQSTPAVSWIVTHGLNRRPACITVYDESDNEVMTAVSVVDLNTIEISMASAMAGRVVIL